jgi:hypothetical protein
METLSFFEDESRFSPLSSSPSTKEEIFTLNNNVLAYTYAALVFSTSALYFCSLLLLILLLLLIMDWCLYNIQNSTIVLSGYGYHAFQYHLL